MKTISKPWGAEIWIEVNDRYVMKKLIMNKDHRCSLQYHEKKHETFYVLSGKMLLRYGENKDELTELHMLPGDSFVLPSGTIHQMQALEDSEYLECSTPELDDVIRLQDDYGR